MKVKLYIENDNYLNDDCCVVAEFPCAPRVDDYIVADWDSVKDAIIRNDRVIDFVEYLHDDTGEWYRDWELQKTRPAPTEEEIRRDMSFDGVGKVLTVTWRIVDGVAECQALVGEM